MNSVQIQNYVEMHHNYPGYPTPPSTSEDSPGSVHLSSPPYTSDNSTSPLHYTNQQQLVFLPGEYTLPNPTYNTLPLSKRIRRDDTNDASQREFRHIIDDIPEIPPCLQIIEQPLDKFRFRYKSEMTGTHGSLNGENSDKTRKMTYPTVQLCNYQGSAVVRCSIWQISHVGDDCMPHAHRLVRKKHGKEECDDPHDMVVNKDTNYQATFHSMGIIHTAKKNIVGELIKKKTKLKTEYVARQGRKELNKKEEMEIKGLAEAESKSINLNVVCLRFDAFYVGANDVYFPLCEPVFSHAINNLKSALTGELKIVRLDHCTSPATGGREIFLLVERVTKKNVKVRFYELDDDDNVIWEDYGKFNDLDVHHQYAIVLRTPPFKNREITTQVNVFVELFRPSDSARSEPKTFTYTPASNFGRPGAKRARPNDFDSGDYDTSSIGSDVLPTTIQNISGEFGFMNLDRLDEPMMPSDEIRKALADVNSDEFHKIFSNFSAEYLSCGLATTENFGNLVSCDFPVNRIREKQHIKPYFNKDYEPKVERVYLEISEFMRTQPTLPDIKKFLKYHLTNSKDEFNAFHMAVMINHKKLITLLVKLIELTREFSLVNIRSEKLGTVLHLATLCNNLNLINTLVTKCNAEVSEQDANLNTPLHIAAVEDSMGYLTQHLLRAKDAKKYIDLENIECNTALHLAVKEKRLRAAEILCSYGANINYSHKCNGFTPLRIAIENEDVPMIEFILYHSDVDPKAKDFTGVDPLQVVLFNQSKDKIKNIINKYMADNHIVCDKMDIKEEPEDDSSEDEMVIFEEEEVKIEPPILPEEWQALYQKATSFTNECLEEVSRELDGSGKWQDLAVLLDIEHLLRMQTFDDRKSPSKQLLNYVVASNGASIKEIRDFLESLDEIKAVQAIDRMVQHSHG